MNPDFRDILSAFAACGVQYMVVGAYAMAAHGLPRATGDIDLWVRRSPQNARRIMAAPARFGAPRLDITEADFQTPDMVVQIGLAPIRDDVLTEITGVEFDEAWPDHIDAPVEGQLVPVIGRENLVKNMQMTGRPKDRADARELQKRNRPSP